MNKLNYEVNQSKREFFAAWITGFVDGEGSFCISFNLKKRFTSGIDVRPSFSVSQKSDKAGINLILLKRIQEFFNCGFIRLSKIDNT
jgi:hypothetical protein